VIVLVYVKNKKKEKSKKKRKKAKKQLGHYATHTPPSITPQSTNLTSTNDNIT